MKNLIVPILFAFVLVSCKKTNSSAYNPLVGTWEATSGTTTTTITGHPTINDDTTFTHGHSTIQIFNADSTGETISDLQFPPDTTAFTYYVSNNSIYYVIGGGYYNIPNKFIVLGNTLSIALTISGNGFTSTSTTHFIRQ